MSKGTQASWARRKYLKVQPKWSYSELLWRSLSKQVYPYQRPFLDAIRAGEQIVPLRGSPTGRFLPRMDRLEYQLLPTSTKPRPAFKHKLAEVDYTSLELHALAHYSASDLAMSEKMAELYRAKAKELDEALWMAAMYGARPGPIGKLTRKDDFVAGQSVYKWEGQT